MLTVFLFVMTYIFFTMFVAIIATNYRVVYRKIESTPFHDFEPFKAVSERANVIQHLYLILDLNQSKLTHTPRQHPNQSVLDCENVQRMSRIFCEYPKVCKAIGPFGAIRHMCCSSRDEAEETPEPKQEADPEQVEDEGGDGLTITAVEVDSILS